jgi:hypothetical protein
MNYLNNRLYFPDPSYGGGGGSEESGEGGDGDMGRDYGGGMEGENGRVLTLQQQIIEIEKKIDELKKRKKRKKRPPPKPEVEQYDSQIEKLEQRLLFLTGCKITSFTISKQYKFLKPNGDRRKIKINGTSGCIFSLTIKDSSGCSILKEEIENVKIPENGIYELNQDFPSISTDEGFSKTKEVYDITIIPAADVVLTTVYATTIQVYQYADPVITVTNSFTAATIGGNIDVTATDVTITGPAYTDNSYIQKYDEKEYNFTPNTYTVLIDEGDSGDVAGKFYIKKIGFNNNTTTNTTIKKVIDRGDKTDFTTQLNLKPLTTRTDTTIEGGDSITGDITEDMNIYAKIEKTKTVFASLDEDDNILDYSRCDTPTDKIELLDTNDLVEGMVVRGGNIIETKIKSIDCDKKIITLSKKHIIKKLTELTFKREWKCSINNIISQRDSSGNACIEINSAVNIPNNTIVNFDDNQNILQGKFAYSGSGGDAITLTITLYVIRFGFKDVTFTLDLDNIITRKPNAYDQEAIIKKNSSGYAIKVLRGDTDANTRSKTGDKVRPPSHGTVGDWDSDAKTFTYKPHSGFTGEDSFTFTMSDGTTVSEEKTVRITVK